MSHVRAFLAPSPHVASLVNMNAPWAQFVQSKSAKQGGHAPLLEAGCRGQALVSFQVPHNLTRMGEFTRRRIHSYSGAHSY